MTEYKSIKEEVLRKLEENLTEIRERFGIETIGIFGSVARGEDSQESDVDVLYNFQNGKATMANLIGLNNYLESMFNRKIDLISRKWMSPILLPYIEDDIIICGSSKEAATV